MVGALNGIGAEGEGEAAKVIDVDQVIEKCKCCSKRSCFSSAFVVLKNSV